jgi:serine/threonine-protein kinase
MAAHDVFGIVGTTQAGNFHVERVVAEGGFGVVYRAQHGAFRAPVAIKCLKIPEQMTKQQRSVFLEKFREEAELMFRLSAAITEVVRPLHVDVLMLPDGRFVPFLALEWLEGESLDGIITRRREQAQAPLGLHKVVKMMRPVATALSRAHRFPGPNGAVSIIHRDLKPENIFVASIGGTESMKILDFGIAKAKSAASQAAGRITGRTLDEDEQASFTPAYGAPEQWTPKTYGETGPWTDIWGLALSMVEVLCGAPVIDGDTFMMRRACLDDKRRPTPRTHGADVPIEVEKVFEKALAVDPRRRYKEVETFWSELEVAMGMEPSLGPRDRRREPSEAAGKEPLGAGLTGTGSRLARIDLQRISVPSMPAVRLPVDAAVEAAVARRKGAGAPPSSAKASLPSSGAAPPSSAKAKPVPRADDDWSGIGVDAGSSGRQKAQAPSRRAAPVNKPPHIPKHSLELEASIPTMEAAPDSARPSRAPMRSSLSGELELSLPVHDVAPPPAGLDLHGDAPAILDPRPQGGMRRSLSGELEMSLPMMEAPPEPAARPQRTLSGEFELPVHDVAPPPASEPAAMMAPAPAPAPPPPAPPPPVVAPPPRPAADPGALLDFELGVPAGKAAPAPAAVRAPVPAADDGPNDAPALAPGVLRRRAAEPVNLGDRLKAPVGALLGALLVALLDIGFQKATGNPLTLGPVRPFWIAAPLALFGVGFLLWRLMGAHEDD